MLRIIAILATVALTLTFAVSSLYAVMLAPTVLTPMFRTAMTASEKTKTAPVKSAGKTAKK
jgi:hypothetical protein